jgi:hypothetical protein
MLPKANSKVSITGRKFTNSDRFLKRKSMKNDRPVKVYKKCMVLIIDDEEETIIMRKCDGAYIGACLER